MSRKWAWLISVVDLMSWCFDGTVIGELFEKYVLIILPVLVEYIISISSLRFRCKWFFLVHFHFNHIYVTKSNRKRSILQPSIMFAKVTNECKPTLVRSLSSCLLKVSLLFAVWSSYDLIICINLFNNIINRF